MLAARRRISTVDEAVAYAEVWRAVFEDARTAKIRGRLARRTAWRAVAQAAGGVYADLPMTAEVAAVDVVRRPNGHITAPESGDGRPHSVVPAIVGTNGKHGTNGVNDTNGTHATNRADDALLRARVFDFLDAQGSIDQFDIGDGNDPYLLWMTARGLGASLDDVADHVRDWCRRGTQRQSPVNGQLPVNGQSHANGLRSTHGQR